MKTVILLLGAFAFFSAQAFQGETIHSLFDKSVDFEFSSVGDISVGTSGNQINEEVFDIDITDVDFNNFEEELNNPNSRLFIISWAVRNELRKLRKQMKCGWPESGIPPLAPFAKKELVLAIKQGIFETFTNLKQFIVDGLDDFKIEKLTINLWTKRIKYNFVFKKITVSAASYFTNTFIDLMKQLGIDIRYEGVGTLGFSLFKLGIQGNFKYKLPILFGSIKIYDFYCLITLDKCQSNITGLLGSGKINRKLNNLIEVAVESAIYENNVVISDTIEKAIVPKVNKFLKGYNAWDLIAFITDGGNSESEPAESYNCIAPPLPWE